MTDAARFLVDSLDAIRSIAGGDTYSSDWVTVDQPMIDRFADATGDTQWIHVDPVRAATSPFGGTVAHGLLTLSLIPVLFNQAFEFRNRRIGLNYGFDKVRFPYPVRAGSHVRGHFRLEQADDVGPGEVRCRFAVTITIEGAERPAVAAGWLMQMGF